MDAIIFVGLQETVKKTELQLIERSVCESLYIKPEEFRSKTRRRHLVEARSIFFHISRRLNPMMTLQHLSGFLNKHHATAIHGIQSCSDWLRFDKSFESKYKKCLELAIQHTEDKFM